MAPPALLRAAARTGPLSHSRRSSLRLHIPLTPGAPIPTLTPSAATSSPSAGTRINPPPPTCFVAGLFSPASSLPRHRSLPHHLPKASPPPLTWVHKWLPEAARSYAMLARLDKPIGTWLLAWPCMWSITIAAMPGKLPDLKMLALFGCGVVLLRGAGCTVNDLLDCDIDNKVERTKTRPFASVVLTLSQGVGFLGFQLLLGLGILLQLNNYRSFSLCSRILGASSLLLVFSYPLMKRFTFWCADNSLRRILA